MPYAPNPNLNARMAGCLYLAVIVGGGFAEAFVRQRLIVGGDAAATAQSLLAHEQLYRWGFLADLLTLVCNVVLAVNFYALFWRVSRPATLLVVFFSLVGTAVQAAVLLFHLAPLMLLHSTPAVAALSQPEREALGYLALRLQSQGYAIALVFFGGFGMSMGYLVARSTFLPRLLGLLMVIGGACYAGNGLVSFVAPQLASTLYLLPNLVSEGSFALWLLLAGVNVPRWRAQTAGAPLGVAP